MNALKSFKVFGELVEVLTTGEQTGGKSTTVTQVSLPGGGPPPHSHLHEDETFFVLEGDYEFLENDIWQSISPGQAVHAKRGSVHTFRNAGKTTGTMLIFVAPAGMERYLAEISTLSLPDDLPKLMAISDGFGITFPTA